MATEAVATAGAQPVVASARPYAPSWVNLVTAWIDRLPGPVWLFYLVFAAFTVVLVGSVTWISGTVPVGVVDPAQTYYGLLLPAALWLIHYLDGVGRQALDRFTPALSVTDADIDRWRYELTVSPARPAVVITILILVGTLMTYAADPVGTMIVGYSPPVLAVRAVYESAIGSILFILVYHSIRQFRLVDRIHQQAGRVDLYRPAPLYAFSKLTSRTAIGLILLVSPSLLFVPRTEVSAVASLIWVAPVILVSVGVFVLPLRGMHQRILAEKERLQAEVGQRIETTVDVIHGSVDGRDFSQADQLHNTLAALIAERDLVKRLPTWPWETGTLGAVASAVLLPIGLWAVTRFLERVV